MKFSILIIFILLVLHIFFIYRREAGKVDIRQLRYFIAIVEEKTISAAATKLHLSQPPLSQQLKNMENHLNVQLFERRGRTLELTDAGQTLYKHALKITKYMEESEREIRETANGEHGTLTLGVNTLSNEHLSTTIQRYHQQHPNITFKIQQNDSAQLCQLVRDRILELAIIRFPLELNDFSILHLKTEPFYFICSSKEILPSSTVTYEDIHHYPLIIPSTEGLGLHYIIMEQFSNYGLATPRLSECSDIALLLELVESGFYASVVPETVIRQQKGYNIQAVKISNEALNSSSGLIWLKDHLLSKTSQNFIKLLKEELEK